VRVNIYSQELTDDATLVEKIGADGARYGAVQLTLHSSEMLHDDDKSAVTLWLPKSPARREVLAQTFEKMAALVRAAPPEVDHG